MKLKPCPLCASKAVAEKYALVFWRVKCTQCMLVLKDMHTSEEAVGKAWNTRLTEQDKRNQGKRWKPDEYFEIVNHKTGEVLTRFTEYEGENQETDVDFIGTLVEYGFTWDDFDYVKRNGTVTGYSGRHRVNTELRYYAEAYRWAPVSWG